MNTRLDKKHTVDLITQRVDDSKAIREGYEKDWKKNLLFLHGKPFLRSNLKGALIDLAHIAELSQLTTSTSRVKLREYFPAHLMFSAFMNILGKLNYIPTGFLAVPGSSQKEDEVGARIGERLLNATIAWQLENKQLELLFWVFWTNKSLLKLTYRRGKTPKRIPAYTFDENEYPLLKKDVGEENDGQLINAKGQKFYWQTDEDKNKKYNEVFDGDIGVSVISPYEYYFDTQAKEIGLSADPYPHWVIQEKVVSQSWLENQGYDLKGVKFSETAIDPITSALAEVEKRKIKIQQKFALYRECWQLPDNYFPEGHFIKMIGDQIIEKDSQELMSTFRNFKRDNGERGIFPYFSFDESVEPITWYSHTLLSKLRPYQKAESVIFSKLIDNCEKIGLVSGFNPGGSTVQPVTDFNDDLVDRMYNTGSQYPPVFIQIDKIPMALLRILELIDKKVELIFIQDIRYPVKADRTLGEIEKIQRQDESKMLIIRNKFVNRYAEMGQVGLAMMKDLFPFGKQMQVLGDANQPELYLFNKTDIVAHCDINIEMGDVPYLTPEGIISRGIQLKELGIPADPVNMVKMLNAKTFVENPEMMLDYKEAEKENLKLFEAKVSPDGEVRYRGQPLIFKVESWENKPVHIKTHENFLKQYNDRLKPAIVQRLVDHIKETKEAEMQEAVDLLQKRQEMMKKAGIEPIEGGQPNA